MTKQEVIDRCNKTYGMIEEALTTLETLKSDLGRLQRVAEDLPVEISDIEDDTKDEEDD